MAWEFLRRMLHFIGGRIVGRLAPRLLLFQYSNVVTHELDDKNKKYRFYQMKTAAEMEIQRLKMRRQAEDDLGLSTVKDQESESTSEASIFDVHGQDDLSDTSTVFSAYL